MDFNHLKTQKSYNNQYFINILFVITKSHFKFFHEYCYLKPSDYKLFALDTST